MKIKYKLLLIIMLMPLIVFAKENLLSINEQDGKPIYNKDLINDKKFLSHLDMMPGETYTDELTIENNTSKSYSIYFKLEESNNSTESLSMLEQMTIKISLEGNKIYEGKVLNAKALDNEKNAILLGEFEPQAKQKMTVETTLSEDYITEESIDTSFDWKFYARYGEEDIQEIVAVENTAMFFSKNIVIVAIICMIIGALILLKMTRKSN